MTLEGSGLGVLSDEHAHAIQRGDRHGQLTPEVRAFLKLPQPLIVTKSNQRSYVHRRVHMDYIGVKLFDAKGEFAGEHNFVGLFTSGAYSRRPSDIPLLRRKVEHVREQAALEPNSHDGKALAHILDNFPRDELFQINEDELFATSIGILRLGERPKVRVFLRFDRFDRFVSALVYVPRDRYDTEVREKIHEILAKAFDGRPSAATPTIDDSMLARVHYIVGRNQGPRPQVDIRTLESDIRAAIRTWEDGFADALVKEHGEAEGCACSIAIADGFSAALSRRVLGGRSRARPERIRFAARRTRDGRIKARAYRHALDPHSALRLKLYVLGPVLPLSASLPVFENLGFKVIAEDSYPVSLKTSDGWQGDAAVLDFLMERADGAAADLAEIKTRLEEAFHAVVSGEAESDGFNRLVVSASLSWRDVTILRTAAKFLRQAGFGFSQDYMEHALSRNPDIAALIVDLFHARHDLDVKDRDARLKTRWTSASPPRSTTMPSLDDDRIVRRFRNFVDCTSAHEFLSARCGRESFLPAICASSWTARSSTRLPAPRPDGRDLRLFAASRRR